MARHRQHNRRHKRQQHTRRHKRQHCSDKCRGCLHRWQRRAQTLAVEQQAHRETRARLLPRSEPGAARRGRRQHEEAAHERGKGTTAAINGSSAASITINGSSAASITINGS
eukprot:2408604-Rhodomonas_salina.1